MVIINNIFSLEFTFIIENLYSLAQIQYIPIILFLLEYKLSIDEKEYKRNEQRLIIVIKIWQKKPKNILPLLLRLYRIHNESGDRFTIHEGEEREDYDLIDYYYNFNINIVCIDRLGQGKSTEVNVILNEWKAKEKGKRSSQTKELAFYQLNNEPIRILDIRVW